MATRRSSCAARATWWLSSLLLFAGCSFEVQGIDSGLLLIGGDGPELVADGAAPQDAPATIGDAAPPDLLPAPDLRAICPNGRTPTHVDDLAEGDISDWGADAPMPWTGQVPPTLKVEADNQSRVAGLISVRLTCSSDQALLYYPKAKNAAWDLSSFTTLELQVAASAPGWTEADPRVIIASSDGDQLVYTPDVNQLPTRSGSFVGLSVPLAGGGGWTRSQTGSPSLAAVNYLGFSMDTGGAGFQVWLDGVRFAPGDFVDCTP